MDLLQTLETQQDEAERRIKSRYDLSMMHRTGMRKPRFNSTLYWDFVRKGYISTEEAEADQMKAEIRAVRTGQRKAGLKNIVGNRFQNLARFGGRPLQNIPIRWGNEQPVPSNQYAPNMATTAARDNRLTPQSKALLQVLHARCARAGRTDTTKGALANIMGRCERTIQRYISELVRFGYIHAHTRRNAKGMYIGLVVAVSDLVKPFYEDLKRTAEIIAPLLAGDLCLSNRPDLEYSEETCLPYKKRFNYSYTKDTLKRDTG